MLGDIKQGGWSLANIFLYDNQPPTQHEQINWKNKYFLLLYLLSFP